MPTEFTAAEAKALIEALDELDDGPQSGDFTAEDMAALSEELDGRDRFTVEDAEALLKALDERPEPMTYEEVAEALLDEWSELMDAEEIAQALVEADRDTS